MHFMEIASARPFRMISTLRLDSRAVKPIAFSKSVARDLATERDSNSATACAAGTCDIRQREYGYEQGCVRGALSFSTNLTDTPVNARRREIGCRAFRVFGLYPKGFRRSARSRKTLCFERAQLACESNHQGCFRSPKSRSKTLGFSV